MHLQEKVKEKERKRDEEKVTFSASHASKGKSTILSVQVGFQFSKAVAQNLVEICILI